MKQPAILAFLLTSALTAFGQGSINFNNRSTSGSPAPVVAPIFGLDPTDFFRGKQGNPATYATSPVPVGTQTYGGAPLVGTGYSAALWGVNVNVPDGVLEDLNTPPIAVVPFRVTTNPSLMGFWQPPAIAPVVPGVVGGTTDRAKFIVRAWDNLGGTITTWAQVLANSDRVAHGESWIFTVNAPLGVSPSIPPPNLIGLESFQLYGADGPATPEPSAIVLASLGIGCCVLFGRRRLFQGS